MPGNGTQSSVSSATHVGINPASSISSAEQTDAVRRQLEDLAATFGRAGLHGSDSQRRASTFLEDLGIDEDILGYGTGQDNLGDDLMLPVDRDSSWQMLSDQISQQLSDQISQQISDDIYRQLDEQIQKQLDEQLDQEFQRMLDEQWEEQWRAQPSYEQDDASDLLAYSGLGDGALVGLDGGAGGSEWDEEEYEGFGGYLSGGDGDGPEEGLIASGGFDPFLFPLPPARQGYMGARLQPGPGTRRNQAELLDMLDAMYDSTAGINPAADRRAPSGTASYQGNSRPWMLNLRALQRSQPPADASDMSSGR